MFSPEELRLLNKTIEIRERIIDNRIKEKLPTTDKDINAATNLLESIDRSIYAKAKLKIEEDSSKNEAATKEVLKDLLLQLHKEKVTNVPEQNTSVNYKPQGIQLNEGEDIIGEDSGIQI
jgi:hypothetical protein